MKKPLVLVTCLALSTMVQACLAQQPGRDVPLPSTHDLKTTPEMWFYEQEMRRYDDPQTAVRRNAEFAQEQRQRRIAARKWYGYSASRPRVNPTPWGASYHTGWSTGAFRPWIFTGRQVIVVGQE